jgi:protein SCO1/2
MLLTLGLSTTNCARGREYDLRGQIVAIDRARREITVKHEDIVGFMPGMTMSFKVRDAQLLEARSAGELIRATLVVNGSDVYLRSIESTGHAALTEVPPPPRIDPLNAGDAVPDTAFIDQDGQPRRIGDWKGRAIAVTFIYTRCPLPDFCPLMDRQFVAVQQDMRDDANLRKRAHLLSVSFDPVFDTPAVLASHAKKLGADRALWTFLTGDRNAIDTFAGRFGVSIVRRDASATDVVHNLRTAVIDGNGRLVRIFNGIQWQPSELVSELRSAVGAR